MCGITGIFDTRGRRDIDRDVLHRMNESQLHRGPDEGGLHVEPGVGLGHRRLSIIDLSTGQQPLYNEDNSVCVVFNGEIYNYQELIPELQALGHVFHTRSDTEVIVHAWEAWGEACVDRFRGMFAFALWDRNRETLFLARDRLGVKPLYYALLDDGTFLFGSELKSMLAHGGLQARHRSPGRRGVLRARLRRRAAQHLPPGARSCRRRNTLLLRRGQPMAEPREYWDVRFTLDARIGDEEACHELQRRLTESIRLRMISEVPLGAFLSGGVDSSAVVAMMAGLSHEPVNTCSIAFADPAFNESAFAQKVADRYQTRHFVDTVESDDFDLIDTLARLYDEPYADSSAIPTYRVCQLARKHVTVALVRRRRRRELRRLPALPHACHGRADALASAAGTAAGRLRRCSAGSTPRPTGRRACFAPRRPSRPWRGIRSTPTSTRCPSCGRRCAGNCSATAFSRQLGGYNALQVFRDHAARADADDPLALVQYLDLKTYLVGDINTKVDRASMAHSLEVREPLMDHLLVEWLATLPSSLKIRGMEGKYLLKKAMEPRLPRDVLYRPKMGFAVPLSRWFRGPLKARVREAILGQRLADTGMFNAGYLNRLVADHEAGARDYSSPIWTLLMFEAFLRNVMDGAPAAKLQPMRILHILDHSLPLHSGYAFRTLSILREQRALGWETFHLTTPRQGAAAGRRGRRGRLALLPHAEPAAHGPARLARTAGDEDQRSAHRRGGPAGPPGHPASAFAGAQCAAGDLGRPSPRDSGGLRDARLLGGCRRRPRHDDRRQPALPPVPRARNHGAASRRPDHHHLRGPARRHHGARPGGRQASP